MHLALRAVARQLKMIERFIWKVMMKGFYPGMIRFVPLNKIKMRSKGIESFINALEGKIENIQDLEHLHRNYAWGFTRPKDEMMHTQWSSCLYPYSSYSNKESSWKSILTNIK